MSEFRLFPISASSAAQRVDTLYLFLVAMTLLLTAGIFLTIFYFAIKYRRRSTDRAPEPVHGGMTLEVVWSVVPLVVTMVIFFWGASIYVRDARPPAGAMEIYVVGKQWMWKLQHPEGVREINELHVPVGRPVKLIMTSEDVIHSFYLPAFRIKMDVLPGRYTSEWFDATRPGEYHLFCAEYCGTKHSGMIGKLHVMEPAAYEEWLNGASARPEASATAAGERLFLKLGCITCHRSDQVAKCPPLVGVWGKPRPLQDGRIVTADEAYVRESILNPKAKVVAGYPPVMPSFQGLVSEEDLLQLMAYIRSLRRE